MLLRALIVALFAVVASVTGALAHAGLISAEPADGAVLGGPPAAMVLTFTEPVSPIAFSIVGLDEAPAPLRPDRQDARRAARISVYDNGIGLETAQMERLFEAFYTTKAHGMGMGLAISRSIIAAHGGRLWVEPNQGPGATFSFSLPAAAASAAS